MSIEFRFDFAATKAALLHLASKELANFDKYRACKLLFLADRDHLLRFGRTITGDSYNALPYGPTPKRTLDLLGNLERVELEGSNPLDGREVEELVNSLEVTGLDHPTYHAKEEVDFDSLSKSDVIVLDEVAAVHGTKTFKDLKDLTHGMKAYTRVWKDEPSRKRFPMNFEDFFLDAPDRIAMLRQIEGDQALERVFPSEVSLHV